MAVFPRHALMYDYWYPTGTLTLFTTCVIPEGYQVAVVEASMLVGPWGLVWLNVQVMRGIVSILEML